MGKVLPNRRYLFLPLKWLVQTSLLFCISPLVAFILVTFKKKNKSNKQYNEPVVKNKHN